MAITEKHQLSIHAYRLLQAKYPDIGKYSKEKEKDFFEKTLEQIEGLIQVANKHK